VQERLLGNSQVCLGNTFNDSKPINWKKHEENKDIFKIYTDQLGITNDYMLEQIVSCFEDIYENRFFLHKTHNKKIIAMHFALQSTMKKEKMSRIPHYITNLFSQNNESVVSNTHVLNSLLYLLTENKPKGGRSHIRKKQLKQLSREKHKILNRCEYNMIQASDLVFTFCDFLNIPFFITKKIFSHIESIQWTFFGIRPCNIVGSIVLHYLHTEKYFKAHLSPKKIAYQLDSTLCAINNFSNKLNLYYKDTKLKIYIPNIKESI
jgi:hypothetical protein